MKHLYPVLLALLFAASLPHAADAQSGSVGIGTTAPDASAALDIVSSSQGVLLPRVAAAAAIASPASGLLVYQTGSPAGFYYNAGTAAAPSWQQLATAAGTAVGAGNGLTKTGSTLELGGALSQNTNLDLAGNALHLLSSTAQQISQLASVDNVPAVTTASFGQSFTLPAGVTITRIDVYGSGGSGTFRLVQGTPSAGTNLAMQSVTYNAAQALTSVVLAAPVTVTSAGTYSFSTGSGGNFARHDGNPYPGGSALTGGAVLTGYDLKFAVHYTTPATALYAAGSGSVGVGTTSPTAALDVAGSTRLRGLGTGLVTSDASGNLGTTAVPGAADFVQNQSAADQTGHFRLSGDGALGGRLGIGTAAPAQKLEVAGSASPAAVGTEPLLRLTRPENPGLKFANTAELRLGTYAGTGTAAATRLDLALGNGSANAPDVTVLSALGSGRVGIGTATPRGTLDVRGGDSYLVADPATGSGQSLFLPGHLFLAPFSGTGGTAFVQARVPSPTASTNIGLTLRTTNAGALVDAVRIDASGDVQTTGDVTVPAAAGYKYAAARTYNHTVSGGDFQPETSASTKNIVSANNADELYSGGADGAFRAPLHLPQGAVITSLVVSYFDGTSAGDVSVALRSLTPGTGNSAPVLATLATFSSSGFGGYNTVAQSTNVTVDNSKAYFLRVALPGATTSLTVSAVKVVYTVTQAE